MSASSRSIVLLSSVCLLLGAAVVKFTADLNTIPSPPSLTAEERVTASPPPVAEEVAALSEDLLSHPPFDPARGKAETKEIKRAAAKPPMKPVAVITSSERDMVLFEQGEGKPLVMAEVGESLKGWKIVSVSQTEVELKSYAGVVEVIRLRRKPAKKKNGKPLLRAVDDEETSDDDDENKPDRSLPVWTPDALEQLVSTQRNR